MSLIIVSKIRDFPQFLEELAQTLRPGGVVLLGDGEMQLYDEWQEPLAYSEQGSPNFSWVHSVFFAGYNAMKSRGGSVDSPSMNPTWLRNIDAFTDVGWHKVFIPIGPWRYGGSNKCYGRFFIMFMACAGDQRELVLAEMLREDCLRYIAGLGPYLLRYGPCITPCCFGHGLTTTFQRGLLARKRRDDATGGRDGVT